MANRLSRRLACLFGLLLTAPPVPAEELRDPTRPPAVLNPSAPAAAPAAPVLQSVLIAPGRRAAIINGVTVEMGGSYGGAKLVNVSEAQVVLRNADQVQILRLFPLVEKQTRTIAENVQADPQAKPGRKASKR